MCILCRFCVHRFTTVPTKASSTILVEASSFSVLFEEKKKDLFEGKEMELERQDSDGEWIPSTKSGMCRAYS